MWQWPLVPQTCSCISGSCADESPTWKWPTVNTKQGWLNKGQGPLWRMKLWECSSTSRKEKSVLKSTERENSTLFPGLSFSLCSVFFVCYLTSFPSWWVQILTHVSELWLQTLHRHVHPTRELGSLFHVWPPHPPRLGNLGGTATQKTLVCGLRMGKSYQPRAMVLVTMDGDGHSHAH